MKYGPYLVTLAWLLWVPLIVGGSLIAAHAAVKIVNPQSGIPLLPQIVNWHYFRYALLGNIVTAVVLGLGLAFWAAKTGAVIAVKSIVPKEYTVQPPNPNQPNVNISAPNNSGVVIGTNQGQVNIQTQRQPKLSLSNWKVIKLDDGTYQSQATLTADIPATFPRVSFIVQSPSLISLKVLPSGGVGFGVVEGTVNGGKFISFANVTPPYVITATTKEQEQVNLQLSDWNPLGTP